jgi:predicted phosphohydrolase
MKLPFAWVTDCHLDHLGAKTSGGFQAFIRTLKAVPETIIVITGDISVAPRLAADLGALADGLADANKFIHFILGNHDCWQDTIEGARRIAKQVAEASTNLFYLPEEGVISFPDDEFLIGVNGYADARAGNFLTSNVSLVDYQLCYSLRGLQKARLQRVLQDLGEESAFDFSELFCKVPASAKRLYVATHAPPFEDAHWYEDKPASPDFMPHFINVALGQEISHAAKLRPELDIVVLSGHVHWGTKIKIANNVTCLVGWAQYGDPIVQDLSKIPERTF